MDNKLNLSQLTDLFCERNDMSKSVAATFVKSFFETIIERVSEGEQVKVKGFGTFKQSVISDRESINVNTGERILIPGHTKITFTPDQTLKDIINRPFENFETIVLDAPAKTDDITEPFDSLNPKDNAVEETESAALISDTAVMEETVLSTDTAETIPEEASLPEEDAEAVSEESVRNEEVNEEVAEEVAEAASDEPVLSEQPAETTSEETVLPEGDTETTPEEVVLPEQPTETPAEETVIPEVNTEAATEETVQTEQPASTAPEVTEPQHDSRNMEVCEKADGKKGLSFRRIAAKVAIWILGIALAALVLSYIVWPVSLLHLFRIEADKLVADDNATVAVKVDSIDIVRTETNTYSVNSEPETVEQKPEDKKVTEAAVKPEAPKGIAPKEKVTEEKKADEAIPKTDSKPDATTFQLTAADEAKDLSLFTLADTTSYRMVGTQEVYTLKNGETLTRVALQYYGTKKLWPYIAAYNHISNVNSLHAGQKLKIPVLSSK